MQRQKWGQTSSLLPQLASASQHANIYVKHDHWREAMTDCKINLKKEIMTECLFLGGLSV